MKSFKLVDMEVIVYLNDDFFLLDTPSCIHDVEKLLVELVDPSTTHWIAKRRIDFEDSTLIIKFDLESDDAAAKSFERLCEADKNKRIRLCAVRIRRIWYHTHLFNQETSEDESTE